MAANGTENERNVTRTTPYPQTPKVNQEPFASFEKYRNGHSSAQRPSQHKRLGLVGLDGLDAGRADRTHHESGALELRGAEWQSGSVFLTKSKDV